MLRARVIDHKGGQFRGDVPDFPGKFKKRKKSKLNVWTKILFEFFFG